MWLDDLLLERLSYGSLAPVASLVAWLRISNATLAESLNTRKAALAVLDRGTGQRFGQASVAIDVILAGAASESTTFRIQLI
jgi:hypothetical protein